MTTAPVHTLWKLAEDAGHSNFEKISILTDFAILKMLRNIEANDHHYYSHIHWNTSQIIIVGIGT